MRPKILCLSIFLVIVSILLSIQFYIFPKYVKFLGLEPYFFKSGLDLNSDQRFTLTEVYSYEGYLDLREYKGTSFFFFNFMPNLNSLNLSGVLISDSKVLQPLKKIQYLEIQHLGLSDLRTLSSLKKLKVLDASYNSFLDINSIEALPSLEEVRFIDCELKQIDFLENFPNAKTILIQGNPIKDTSVLRLLTHLKVLGINPESLDTNTLSILESKQIKVLSYLE